MQFCSPNPVESNSGLNSQEIWSLPNNSVAAGSVIMRNEIVMQSVAIQVKVTSAERSLTENSSNLIPKRASSTTDGLTGRSSKRQRLEPSVALEASPRTTTQNGGRNKRTSKVASKVSSNSSLIQLTTSIPKTTKADKSKSKNCGCLLCAHDVSVDAETPWREVIKLALQVMVIQFRKQFFKPTTEIVEYVESHWARLFKRPIYDKWEKTMMMILSKYKDTTFIRSSTKKGTWGVKDLVFELDGETYDGRNYLRSHRQESLEIPEEDAYIEELTYSQENEIHGADEVMESSNHIPPTKIGILALVCSEELTILNEEMSQKFQIVEITPLEMNAGQPIQESSNAAQKREDGDHASLRV